MDRSLAAGLTASLVVVVGCGAPEPPRVVVNEQLCADPSLGKAAAAFYESADVLQVRRLEHVRERRGWTETHVVGAVLHLRSNAVEPEAIESSLRCRAVAGAIQHDRPSFDPVLVGQRVAVDAWQVGDEVIVQIMAHDARDGAEVFERAERLASATDRAARRLQATK